MKSTAFIAALALACVGFSASVAEAKQRQRVVQEVCNGPDIMRPCVVTPASSRGFLEGVREIRVTMKKERRARQRAPRATYKPTQTQWGETTLVDRARSYMPAAQIVGGRPSGCPSRFCGCGASLYLFGRIIPSLNLAANWLRFPRVAPAPNMVAARRGHVFVLKQHISGNVWLAYDANSGGKRTRVHPRSIAGFTIVDPSGAA